MPMDLELLVVVGVGVRIGWTKSEEEDDEEDWRKEHPLACWDSHRVARGTHEP